MTEEGRGPLGTTMDGGSESILSTASALSGGGCKWATQGLCALLIPFTAGAQALPSQRVSQCEGGLSGGLFLPRMVNAPFLSHVLQCPWPL